ncbi:LPXTG cell wall anchor domain-containing protein [Agromyces silvae]|uniref:LPXTG cell wall anchor domain-containing protein n=1 Tax=Agromyces silvae TaxID=3388266 RepID=UPI00280C0C94|nr:LPXTG cell wall anchor domain-containing protein [Agromyces protaetiae]
MLRKLFAGAAVAVVALFAAPAAANAYGEQPPIAETVQAGEAVALTFTGLPPNTPSTAVAPDAVTLAILKAGTASKPTDANGSVTYTASATQPGTYTITVTAGQSVATATLTVVPADGSGPGTGPGTGPGAGPDSGLPSTGVDTVLFMWIGGGALLLGAALVVVLSTVRRSRNQA